MTRRVFAMVAFLFVFSAPVFAWTVTVYTYHSVAGVDYAEIGPSLRVKLCHKVYAQCFTGTTDGYGKAWISVQREGDYYAYVWDPWNNAWGSIDVPDPGTYHVYPIISEQIIALSAFPRPLQPGLVSPCNNCLVGLGNFYLKWTDGLDATRRASNWYVSYEIWTSVAFPGEPQSDEWLNIPDTPCNPDAQGNCQWYVDTLESCPGCRYSWRIVVKENFGNGIVYKTSGPQWYLYQRY